MPGPQTNWDFETLVQQDNTVLDQLLQTGAPITAVEVAGHEYRGWNMNAATTIIGTRKFKKGFFRDPGTGGFWGYNIRVKQGSISEPWEALPSENDPKRFYFFGVSDPTPGGLYPNALVVDYRRWPDNWVIDPVRYTVDYLVAPNPGNKNLLLGKSYGETPLGRTFLGYFALERHNPTDYQGPKLSPILNDDQAKVLRAVLECQMAVLQPSGYKDDLGEVAADVEGFLRDASADARGLVLLLLEKIAVDTRVLPPFHPFWEWDLAHRKEWLVDLAKSPLAGGKQMRDLLGVLMSLGWLVIYSRPAGRRSYGASDAEPTDPATGKPAKPVSVKEPAHPADYLAVKYKVCVIGSGAGGAMAAARLAEAGKGPVLVVEAGKWISPEDYPRLRDDQALRRCYASAGVQPALSSPIPIPEFLLHGRVSTVNVLQGGLVGGGPAVNNAICLRMSSPQQNPQGRWKEWEAAGIPFGYAELEQIYDTIYDELSLDAANVDAAAGWRSALFAPNNNGWKRLDVAVRECVGCGGCNTGCRYGRKSGGLGSAKSYLERARAAGTTIGAQLLADRFEVVGGRARRLVVKDLRNGGSFRVEADAFVLAAGPMASTAILARTGLGLSLPLGRRASANVVTPVYGVFPGHADRLCEPGLQMCYFVGEEGKLLRETWFHYPGSIAVSLPGWFEEHMSRMKDYANLGCLGVVVPTGPHGQVGSDGRLFLSLNDQEFGLMKQGIVNAARDLFAAGAVKVHLASKDPTSFDVSQSANLEALLDGVVDEQGDLNLATAHPQGGNAISTDNSISVVDDTFQVRGAQGLFVADASLFPAGCGVNPMMTTLALAHMAAAQVQAFLP
jgi:choline dehydrogenase-like flavoprotein